MHSKHFALCFWVSVCGSIVTGQNVERTASGILRTFSPQQCRRFLSRATRETRNRFSPQQLNIVCDREQSWFVDMVSKISSPQLSPAQESWLNGIWSCKDLTCICEAVPFCQNVIRPFGGNVESLAGLNPFSNRRRNPRRNNRNKRQIRTKLSPAIRKEYRMLSDEERNSFHTAMNRLKTELIEGISKYDLLTIYHTPEQSPGAHFGPALLPFHRELLNQLEIALRMGSPDTALPYWDSRLDQPLPDPTHSVMWTPDFMGDGNGEVTTGPFASWLTHPDPQLGNLSPRRKIVRALGQSQYGGLYRDEDIEKILNFNSFREMSYCVDPYFELVHGTVHMWIGGHMNELRISPNDPAFFLIHSFIDKVWEQFRQTKQTAQRRENEFVADAEACNTFHYGGTQMKPFNLKNRDGLSNKYTREFYNYEEVPTCSRASQDCGSKYLFCDTRVPGRERCLSKIRMGGNCTGFQNTGICSGGFCVNNRCAQFQQRTDPPTTRPPPTTTTTPSTTTRWVTRRNIFRTRSNLWNRFSTRQPVRRTWRTRKIPRTRRTRRTTTRTTPKPATTTKLTKAPDRQAVLREELSQPKMGTVWFPITVLTPGFGSLSRVTGVTNGSVVSVHGNGMALEGEFASPDKRPYYSGAAFAQVISPFSQDDQVVASLKVTNSRGQECMPLCLTDQHESGRATYTPCNPEIVLDVDPRNSDDIPFSPYRDHARFLSWSDDGKQKLPDTHLFMCDIIFEHTPGPARLKKRRGVKGGKVKVAPTIKAGSTSFADEKRIIKFGPGRAPQNEFGGKSLGKRMEVDVISQPAKKSRMIADGGCHNTHQCCSIWANVGECKRNAWMQKACEKDCNVCSSGKLFDPSSCQDNHPKCERWAKNGKCGGNQNWMYENCKRSCGKCSRGREELRLSCGGQAENGECRDHNPHCKLWARKGSCRTNPWWMAQNCAHSCRKCRNKRASNYSTR